jgi:hypothetical protein
LPADVAQPRARFELERVEWSSHGRLELAGRWFGVRGRRFVRPTLGLNQAGERRRLLALLDHKPWASQDGERWLAAFPWQGEPVGFDHVELAVAPGLEVALPPPPTQLAAGRRRGRGAAGRRGGERLAERAAVRRGASGALGCSTAACDAVDFTLRLLDTCRAPAPCWWRARRERGRPWPRRWSVSGCGRAVASDRQGGRR